MNYPSHRAYLLLLLLLMLNPFSSSAGEWPFTVKVSGKGSPMIFIPGYTCSGDVWNETIKEFSGSHECHVITIRGFGGEAASGKSITLGDVKDGIKSYISEKKMKNVILVGHSMGGFLAQWTASEMKAPELAGVVVVDAVPFIGVLADSTAAGHETDTAAAARMETMIKNQPEAARKLYGKMTARQLCLDSTHHDQIAGWSAVSDPHTCAWLLMEMAAKDLRKTISAISVPVLVLAAWEKGYGVPMENIRTSWTKHYSAAPKLELHMVEDSRHFIMFDAPQKFYSELNTFAARCTATAR